MKTREKNKSTIKNSIGRAAFAAIALILQIGWLVMLLTRASAIPYIALALNIIALLVVAGIFAQKRNSASKMSWGLLILLLPVLGLSLYFLYGQPWATYSMRRRFENIAKNLQTLLPQDPYALEALAQTDPAISNQSAYIRNWAKYPVYRNTQVEFHPQTDAAFAALKAELRGAKKFIFMEYHAIELSQCFMEIEDILAERAANGVEVRLFYDDIGSFTFIGPNFVQRMKEKGIHCRIFNPIMPIISAFMNNRDHRKITVVDGRVAFTGGYNLADEYFNVKHPYGHWKDTGVKITGDAVRSFTVMFLEMWNAVKLADRDYSVYTGLPAPAESDGFVQPYADTPLDDERVGENVYLNIVKNAKKYVYITTPYLILDDEMVGELVLAAKRGVDVRIITPGIPDKKVVYRLTRLNYSILVNGGVRIFEYTPGFMHAKQMLSDGEAAVVGTINLDFRSLYLHFENAVYLYRCACLKDIYEDFERTFPLCCERTEDYKRPRGLPIRILQSLLRLFSPLL